MVFLPEFSTNYQNKGSLKSKLQLHGQASVFSVQTKESNIFLAMLMVYQSSIQTLPAVQ